MKSLCSALLVALTLMCGPALADAVSGPDRTTIIKQDWGTIYHLPFSRDTDMSQDMFGEYMIRSRRGSVTYIKQEGYSQGYVVWYPDDSSLSIRKGEGGELDIRIRGKRCWRRPTHDGWVMKLPDDEITLHKKGNEVRLSGKQGTTVVTDRGRDGFTVSSAAGETRYVREDFDQPFKLSGVAIQGHPYVVHGVWLEAHGVGAFIDFKLGDYTRAFSLLGWFPMIRVDGD